jgi:carbonic anhydrase
MTPFPQPLTDRYRRFKHRHFDANIYEELATYGQSPDVMIVSCCDSRVDPETIFSAMPGELFVMRNVANLIPPYETGGTYHGVSAAIEFAVLNLRIRHLLIMGHSGCGGVKAALDREVRETEGQFITKWMAMLDTARLAVLASHQGASRKDMAIALEHEGIKASLKNLRTFPFLAERENNGKLALHGAYFDIATGNLSVLNETTGQFYAL